MNLRCSWIVLAAFALLGRSAIAQTLEGSVSTFTVQNHVRFANTTLEQSGPWFAADAAVRFGRLRGGVGVATGKLEGSDDALHPEREARATTITLHGYARPWLGLGAHAEARRFETDVGTTIWRLIGVNALATPAISEALEGLADITYWPAAGVIEGESMAMAFRAVLGASYRVTPLLYVRLAYRFERFDFQAQGSSAARLEQFRGAMLGGVIRLNR